MENEFNFTFPELLAIEEILRSSKKNLAKTIATKRALFSAERFAEIEAEVARVKTEEEGARRAEEKEREAAVETRKTEEKAASESTPKKKKKGNQKEGVELAMRLEAALALALLLAIARK